MKRPVESDYTSHVAYTRALEAYCDTLAQPPLPMQEPWMYRIWNDKDAQWQLTDDCSWPAEPIYTTPPKRPWVGLTEEEMQAVVDKQLLVSSINVYFKAIETKLKEKNT